MVDHAAGGEGGRVGDVGAQAVAAEECGLRGGGVGFGRWRAWAFRAVVMGFVGGHEVCDCGWRVSREERGERKGKEGGWLHALLVGLEAEGEGMVVLAISSPVRASWGGVDAMADFLYN